MFSDTIGYVGALVVREDCRKMGIGKCLLQKSTEYVGEKNFGLTSVDEIIPLYRSKGFQYTSFRMATYIGKINKTKLFNPASSTDEFSINEYSEEMFDEICRYDQKIHILPHREFLKLWIDRNNSTSFVAISKSGGVVGYATIHPENATTSYIGPLFADNDDIAQALWSKALSSLPEGTGIHFNIIKGNKVTSRIAEEHNLDVIVNGTRLYTKNIIEFPLNNVYAMTTSFNALI